MVRESTDIAAIESFHKRNGRIISDPAIKFHKGRLKNYLLLIVFVKITY
jgi:hypothetical protein